MSATRRKSRTKAGVATRAAAGGFDTLHNARSGAAARASRIDEDGPERSK